MPRVVEGKSQGMLSEFHPVRRIFDKAAGEFVDLPDEDPGVVIEWEAPTERERRRLSIAVEAEISAGDDGAPDAEKYLDAFEREALKRVKRVQNYKVHGKEIKDAQGFVDHAEDWVVRQWFDHVLSGATMDEVGRKK